MRIFLLLVLLFALAPAVYTQSLTGRIVDGQTGEAVPFATIVTGANKGTISNEEGYFSLDTAGLGSENIQISCMGYETLEIPPDTLTENPILSLTPAAIRLNEVRIGERIPDADEIVRKVNENIAVNYNLDERDYSFFYRESEYMNWEQLDLEVEKDSELDKEQLAKAGEELNALERYITDSRAVSFFDFNGNYKALRDTSHIWVDRATELVDAKNDFTTDKLQERAQKIILSHLDTTQTYKVKTGIITVEDSIAMNDEMGQSGYGDSISVKALNSRISDVLAVAGFEEENRLGDFLDENMYRYELVKPTYFNGFYVYAVRFTPRKRKAKYAGTLYVDASNFAVLKADYKYAEGRNGQSVNLKLLLGIKYIENLDRGTMVFQGDDTGKYHPYYIQKEYGNYVYLHRSLKFIENSASRKKVLFDFLLEGGVRQKESILIRPSTTLESPASQGDILVQKLDSYEPTIWQDTEIIAPLEEMKNFKVVND
jgi:hypothetical protein